jgi:hypothetical protein
VDLVARGSERRFFATARPITSLTGYGGAFPFALGRPFLVQKWREAVERTWTTGIAIRADQWRIELDSHTHKGAVLQITAPVGLCG